MFKKEEIAVGHLAITWQMRSVIAGDSYGPSLPKGSCGIIITLTVEQAEKNDS